MAPLNYIKEIRGNELLIHCINSTSAKCLVEMGARRGLLDRKKFVLRVGSKTLLADALMKLRDAGFLFAGASSGWPPAAVFENLRAEGSVSGKISVLIWKSKDQPHIEEGR